MKISGEGENLKGEAGRKSVPFPMKEVHIAPYYSKIGQIEKGFRQKLP